MTHSYGLELRPGDNEPNGFLLSSCEIVPTGREINYGSPKGDHAYLRKGKMLVLKSREMKSKTRREETQTGKRRRKYKKRGETRRDTTKENETRQDEKILDQTRKTRKKKRAYRRELKTKKTLFETGRDETRWSRRDERKRDNLKGEKSHETRRDYMKSTEEI